MNEELKKIKQHAYVLGGDEPETIGQQSAGIIIACAERMAEEIARLKAELEKRPEVVYCKDCDPEKCCTVQIFIDGMGTITPSEHKDIAETFYCAMAVRKESEEKR